MNKLGQRLIKVHAIAGIFFGLLFYIIMYFGIFSLMQNYINTWEKPSRHFANTINKENIPISKYVDKILLDPNMPKHNIKVILPDVNKDKSLIVSQFFVDRFVLNPNTGELLKDEGLKKMSLSFFLHNMHTGRAIYKSVGFTIFGIVAVASIFLILTGLIQVLTIKYSNKGKTALKSTSKWHRKLSLWFFFPILMIFISGAALNLQIKGVKKLSAPVTYFLTDKKEYKWKNVLGSTLFPNPEVIKEKNISAKMMPLEKLYEKAREINPSLEYAYLTLYRWTDLTAQVKFSGYNSEYPFFNGAKNRPSITLSAVDGTLVRERKVFDFPWISTFYEFIHFLHFVPFMGFVVKFLLLIIVALFNIGIVFGIWLYLEKKAKKFERKIPFYNFVSRLSMTIIIGVLPATAIIFCLQWLLPFDMKEKLLWQQGIFFLTWLSMGLISFIRMDSNKGAKDILYIGSVLFLLAPLIHWFFSGYSAFKLYYLGIYTILGVDIGLLFLSFLCFIFAYKLPNKREDNKELWKKF